MHSGGTGWSLNLLKSVLVSVCHEYPYAACLFGASTRSCRIMVLGVQSPLSYNSIALQENSNSVLNQTNSFALQLTAISVWRRYSTESCLLAVRKYDNICKGHNCWHEKRFIGLVALRIFQSLMALLFLLLQLYWTHTQ